MRTGFVFGFVGLGAFAAAAVGNTTPIGVFGGSTYFTSDAAVTITEARALADDLGGHVVSINTEDEQVWLNSVVGFTERFWIGLSDEQVEGEFVWDSGEVFDYSYWNSGEPNDQVPGEDFVWLNWNQTNGRWNDVQIGADPVRAIIEVVPAPGSIALLGAAGFVVGRRRR